MYMETVVVIRKSSKADKKYEAVIDGRKTVPFGAKGYSDFTLHKNPERKQRYIQRYQKMKIGVRLELILLDFTLNMSFGIKIQYKNQ